MHQAGIVGCHRRKRPVSITRSDPRAEAAPDRVDRQFVATAPNQLWVADVTYVPTVQGWLYLACVTDVFSRMVIGWSMASHRKTDLVVDAVAMAVHRRGGHVPGVFHHSDRGGEYSSHALERELRRHGAPGQHGQHRGLLRRAGRERIRHAGMRAVLPAARRQVRHPTRGRARRLRLPRDLPQPRRRHSALGQIAPATFEARHTLTTAA